MNKEKVKIGRNKEKREEIEKKKIERNEKKKKEREKE